MSWVAPPTFTDGEYLDGTRLGWIRDSLRYQFSRPMCRAHGTRDQSLAYADPVEIDFDFTDEDTDGIHGGPTFLNEPATSLFTIRTGGVYLVTACVRLARAGVGAKRVEVSYRNLGSSWNGRAGMSNATNVGDQDDVITVPALVKADAGQQIGVLAYAVDSTTFPTQQISSLTSAEPFPTMLLQWMASG